MTDERVEQVAGTERDSWPECGATGDSAARVAVVTWRELVSVVLVVVLSDVTIFRGAGLAGYGLLFLVAPLLLMLGAPRPRFPVSFWVVGLMLMGVAARLAWGGWGLPTACGFVLLVAFAMVLAGQRPYVMELLVFALQSLVAGYVGLRQYRRTALRITVVRALPGVWLNVGLPLAAFVAFGLLFVVANPDLMKSFGETLDWLSTTIREWLWDILPSWQEALFWLTVLWITVGLLRPLVGVTSAESGARSGVDASRPSATTGVAPLYVPYRNTLVTVVALFAVYLVFEFSTLWCREFPPGFHYSGYAHEGAAWLTVALALATLILSLIFRGAILGDVRLPTLRRLAWIWSVENVLLASAVYHRLFIYVGFNGMTRMRTIGFFGISCVVVGFVLAVWKIVRGRDFTWLVRHQLWALGFFIYLYALSPVDYLVHRYNTERIMAGDSAPAVQLSVHPINAEGFLALFPLLECPDEIVREGVLALLADRQVEAEQWATRHAEEGWTSFQGAEYLLLRQLRAHQLRWADYGDAVRRRAARARFDQYTYQWY